MKVSYYYLTKIVLSTKMNYVSIISCGRCPEFNLFANHVVHAAGDVKRMKSNMLKAGSAVTVEESANVRIFCVDV